MERNLDETLNEAIDRLIAGAPVQDVLASFPAGGEELAAALRDAQTLLRSGPPSDPASLSRAQARDRMMAELDAARHKAEELKPAPRAVDASVPAPTPYVTLSRSPRRTNWLKAFAARSASFRAAAVAGSVALVGVLGIGAAAATGNTPEPVRELFSSSGAALRVEFDGVIVAADAGAQTFDVDVAGDVRTVRVVESTELSRSGGAIAFDQFTAGAPVEVKGALQPDDTIVASRVHLEDEGLDDDPEASPTIDDDDDDEDRVDNEDNDGNGNSGHGNSDDAEGDDDDDDEDNFGPGNGDDADDEDDDDEDNSRPGNGDDDDDDDDDDEDNSGPGNGGDADDDDNSGPGSGDDNDDDEGDD